MTGWPQPYAKGFTTMKKTSAATSTIRAQVPARATGSVMTLRSASDGASSWLATAASSRRFPHGSLTSAPIRVALTNAT